MIPVTQTTASLLLIEKNVCNQLSLTSCSFLESKVKGVSELRLLSAEFDQTTPMASDVDYPTDKDGKCF